MDTANAVVTKVIGKPIGKVEFCAYTPFEWWELAVEYEGDDGTNGVANLVFYSEAKANLVSAGHKFRNS